MKYLLLILLSGKVLAGLPLMEHEKRMKELEPKLRFEFGNVETLKESCLIYSASEAQKWQGEQFDLHFYLAIKDCRSYAMEEQIQALLKIPDQKFVKEEAKYWLNLYFSYNQFEERFCRSLVAKSGDHESLCDQLTLRQSKKNWSPRFNRYDIY